VDTQLIWYAAAAILLFFFVRRTLRMRALKQYTTSEIEARLKSKGGLLLLDVRTDAERQSGSIRGSLHIPIASLRTRMKELEQYKSREIICYCASGSRSASAALLLNKNGFNAGNLRGGMGEWNFAHRGAASQP
jgi:rhodanese-related sulfurtransferase